MQPHTPNANYRLAAVSLTLGLLGYAGASTPNAVVGWIDIEAQGGSARTMPSDFIDTVHSIRFIESESKTQP
jgi:hypothetical protein